VVPGAGAQVSLDAVGKGGDYVGAAVSYGQVVEHHSMIVSASGIGTPTRTGTRTVTVMLEISHDLVHWVELARVSMSTDYPQGAFIQFPAPYARARIEFWGVTKSGAAITATIAGV